MTVSKRKERESERARERESEREREREGERMNRIDFCILRRLIIYLYFFSLPFSFSI